MPYRIDPSDSNCVQVQKSGEWERLKCHDSAGEASDHLAALQINVDKSLTGFLRDVFHKHIDLVKSRVHGLAKRDFEAVQMDRQHWEVMEEIWAAMEDLNVAIGSSLMDLPDPAALEEVRRSSDQFIKFVQDKLNTLPANIAKMVPPTPESGEGRVHVERIVTIKAYDEPRRIVTGVVMEPEVVDAHGDIQSAEEIEAAMERFMTKSWNSFNLQHAVDVDGVQIIESYLAPTDLEIGGQPITKGSWVMSVKCPESLWPDVVEGGYTGFSIEGTGLAQTL